MNFEEITHLLFDLLTRPVPLSVLARHELMRLFDALFTDFDARSQMIEIFKSFQPEVKASKLFKRFQSYGHLKFCIEMQPLQVVK